MGRRHVARYTAIGAGGRRRGRGEAQGQVGRHRGEGGGTGAGSHVMLLHTGVEEQVMAPNLIASSGAMWGGTGPGGRRRVSGEAQGEVGRHRVRW